MALIGNTADAYAQTWHLPCDPDRLTYAEMIDVASQVTGRRVRYTTIPEPAFRVGARVNQAMGEAEELLPRYATDNIFDSTKFTARFPDLPATRYRDGIQQIVT